MGAVSAPVEYHVERMAGVQVPKPLPKRLHALVQTRTILELAQWTAKLNLEVLSELDVFTGGGDWLVTDVVVAAVDADYDNGKLANGAHLAVEIMSPGQTIGQLFDKCERLHAGGTKYCWVLWPQRREAWHYHAAESPLQVKDTLSAGPIEVALAPLFANLPAEEESAN
jgi:Uma2 family endonuclease